MATATGIDIAGIDRAELVHALWQRTNGHPFGPEAFDLSIDKARRVVAELEAMRHPCLAFRTLFGRPIHVTICGSDLFDADLYDSAAPSGPGTCARIILELRMRRRA